MGKPQSKRESNWLLELREAQEYLTGAHRKEKSYFKRQINRARRAFAKRFASMDYNQSSQEQQ